jgi:hypothetical protein
MTFVGRLALAFVGATLLSGNAWAGAPPADSPLAPLAAFVGKTWKGDLAQPGAAKPQIDVSRWEWALGGKAIRSRHSVNDGEYGGESFIVWDAGKKSLVYFYFTNAGFYTQGSLRFEGGKWVAQEAVSGALDGITEVRSTGELLPDGRLRVHAEYLKNGEWVPGRDTLYTEDPSARVVLE